MRQKKRVIFNQKMVNSSLIKDVTKTNLRIIEKKSKFLLPSLLPLPFILDTINKNVQRD